MTALASALLLAPGTVAPAADTEKPLKVFILIGTSNMMGFGANIGQLPPELKHQEKDVMVCQDGAWVPLKPGEWKQAGPEHSFAQAMVKDLGEPIGIIKVVKPFKNGKKSWPTRLWPSCGRRMTFSRDMPNSWNW